MPVAKISNDDYVVERVLFKRTVKNLLSKLNNRANDAPLKLQELQEMVAKSFGYADLHELTEQAKGIAEQASQLRPAEKMMVEMLESEAESRRPFFESVCSKKLLERHSLVWLDRAIEPGMPSVCCFRWHGDKVPRATVIVGKDCELVLKAWFNIHELSKYYDLNKQSLMDIHNDLSSFLPPKSVLQPDGKLCVRLKGHHYCIGGLTKHTLSEDLISAIVGISNIDNGSDFVFAVTRDELSKLTQPDISKPHLKHLRVIDLDEIEVNPRTAIRGYRQMVEKIYRHDNHQ